jgi:hypothetical protein
LICDRVLATSSEDISDGDPSDEHLTRGARLDFSPTEDIAGRVDGKDQFVEMKTLCTGKRAVKMPSNEEHKFLKFCGLGKNKKILAITICGSEALHACIKVQQCFIHNVHFVPL